MALFTAVENKAEPVPQDMYGKWTMIKMGIKNGFYFDVSDPDSSFERFSALVIQNRSAYLNSAEMKTVSKADSLAIKTDFDKAYGQFIRRFIEFKKDKSYLTNQNG
ncbi:MAG: hypothetical protein H7Y86_14050 [Rhizobacter sp.]|nr:hypothetical protein [Ferruginibacter sp.]